MEVEIIRDLEKFQTLKSGWDELNAKNGNNNFYRSYDWFFSALNFFSFPPEELFIITFRSGGRLIAVAPCCINKRDYRFYPLKSLEIIGNIYSPSRECVVLRGMEEEVAGRLLSLLTEEEASQWQMLDFTGMARNDSFFVALRGTANTMKLRSRSVELYENLANDFFSAENSDLYFKSLTRNWRKNIKKGINRLNRLGGFEVKLFTDSGADLDSAMIDYNDIYSRSWKIEELDPNFHKKLAQYTAGKEMLRLFILYCNSDDGGRKIPVAANYMIKYGRRVFFLKSCYRQDYSKSSAGTVLNWFSFKHLIDVDRCNAVDFQIGDDAYKKDWGGKVNSILDRFVLANPRSRKATIDLFNESNVMPALRNVKRLFRRES